MEKHRSPQIYTVAIVGLTMVAGTTGCESNKPDAPATPSAQTGGVSETAEQAHAHPTTGPHDGPLIELGQEAYHAEMIHDESAGVVAIYVLNASAKRAEPIDATVVQINVSGVDVAKQFTLSADPDEADPEGKSSRFTSSEAELMELLDQEDAEAQLVISIAGKQYRGTIAHEHGEH